MSGTDYIKTPTLGLFKPNYDMDDDQWGYHLNANADMLDAYLSPGGNPAFVPVAGGTMTGLLALSGDPIGPLDAVTKQYLDAHTGTGSQIYAGGWNPVTNTPTLASGALANGALAPKGTYYLATVGGTSVAIDGNTTWLAGDYITSNGTTWDRVQASSSPYLPLIGGAVTGFTTFTAAGGFAIQVGTNTTGKTFQLNGSPASPSPLEFAQANVKRQHLQLDAAGNFTGFAYDGAGANATRWMTAAGTTGALTFYTAAQFNAVPFQHKPPAIVWANNEASLFAANPVSLAGSFAGNAPYLYAWSVPLDTAVNTNPRTAVNLGSMLYRYGGTGHGGGRTGLTVQLLQDGITDTSGPSPGEGSYSAGRFWVDHFYNSGGTSFPNNVGGYVYGGNYKVYLHQGATYYGVYNGTFEADMGVEGSTRRVTIAGTVTAGDTLALTFTSASIVGSPLTVSITAATGDTVNSLAAKLYAKITAIDALNTAQVGASYGAIGVPGSAVYASPTLASLMLVYAPWIGLTVSSAVGGAATETITIGSETVGASTNNKLGMSMILANADGLRGYLPGSALFAVMGGVSNGTASGWEYLIGIGTTGGRGGSWPFSPTATLFGMAVQSNALAKANNAPCPVFPARLFSVMDYRTVNYTKSSGSPLAFPNFRLNGAGVLRLGGTTLTPSSAGLAISAAGWSGTTIAVSAGGGVTPYCYFPGDICFDAYDGQYEVTTVNSGGGVTAFNVLVAPTAPAGAAPAAVQVTQGGSGQNFAVNITWVSATTVAISAGSGAAAPTAGQLAAGTGALWKNTTDASVKLYYNDAGTMRSAVLT